jgi:transposase
MAVVDGHGLPVGITVASATPAEVKLVEQTIESIPGEKYPERLIGDMAYDSDPLAQELDDKYGIELIAPNRRNRKYKSQDGRPLRRYKRRWKVERLWAWLGNFRRLVVRYERNIDNYLSFLYLGCTLILLRHF